MTDIYKMLSTALSDLILTAERQSRYYYMPLKIQEVICPEYTISTELDLNPRFATHA